jgi:hypothetical protein
MNKFYTTFFLLFAIHYMSYAQKDTLKLNNGNIIVGDLKAMTKGVLTIEPPYSAADFKIKWEDIQEMKTSQRYLITISNGQRINGNFYSAGKAKVHIENENGDNLTVAQNEIVDITSIESGFLSRLSASIDFGYSLTKANNQQQFNSNLRMDYLEDRWSADLRYNSLIANQDNVNEIQRNNGAIGYRYFLPGDWNLGADINLLSNTEQSIDLRTTGILGIGNFISRSNSMYWNVFGGLAFTNEAFSTVFNPEDGINNTAPNRESLEGFIGTDLNLYDIGDLNLLTYLGVYPTIISDENVEPGRIRTDFRFDAKYDNVFIKDFYIRAGFSLNYDNRPVESGKEIDYIFTTGFGWEL